MASINLTPDEPVLLIQIIEDLLPGTDLTKIKEILGKFELSSTTTIKKAVGPKTAKIEINIKD